MRVAPSVVLINSLIKAGARVQAFDSVANEEAVKNFPKDWIPEKLTFCDDNYSALENSNALVLIDRVENVPKSQYIKNERINAKSLYT